MITNNELANIFLDLCTKYMDHEIYIKSNSWTRWLSKHDILARYGTAENFLEKSIKSKSSIRYSYKQNDIEYEINESIGFPWNANLASMFHSYMVGSIDDSDLNRFVSLIEINAEKVFQLIEESDVKHYGSNKFKYAVEQYADFVKSNVNKDCKKYFIDTIEICEPTERSNRFELHFKFNVDLPYSQKTKMQGIIFSVLRNKYNAIMAENNYCSISSIPTLNFCFSEPKKCVPAKEYIISFAANNWNSIGLNESSQFMPIMMKKK